MLKNDLIRLRHILDAAREAVNYSQNRTRADLDKDRLLNLSLVRLLEIVGEAAKGISPALRADHPEIAWDKMAGMRDRLVHGYFDVSLDVVWRTVVEDLPPLMSLLEKLLISENELP